MCKNDVLRIEAFAYLLRKWHYRCPRVDNQSWVPYVIFGGLPSWIGLIEARIHPALALVFIVPFMPAADASQLEAANAKASEELKQSVMEHVGKGTEGLSAGQV